MTEPRKPWKPPEPTRPPYLNTRSKRRVFHTGVPLALGVIGTVILLQLIFWGVVLYVVGHFVIKWW